MLLYHFTPAHSVKWILRNGLIKGRVPSHFDAHGVPRFFRGFQWLTSDPEFQSQSWATLPFSLTHKRLAIDIPQFALNRVIKCEDFFARSRGDSAEFISSFPGNKHWRLFKGRIPPQWILSVDSKRELNNLEICDA